MTNQTIEQAVEEAKEILRKVSIGEMYRPDAEARLTKALQAQRDAGAREERKNIIEIVKFTKFRDTQTQEPYHKYLQQSKGVEYIRNKILKALTQPTS